MTSAPITTADMRALLPDLWDAFREQATLQELATYRAILARLEQQDQKERESNDDFARLHRIPPHVFDPVREQSHICVMCGLTQNAILHGPVVAPQPEMPTASVQSAGRDSEALIALGDSRLAEKILRLVNQLRDADN